MALIGRHRVGERGYAIQKDEKGRWLVRGAAKGEPIVKDGRQFLHLPGLGDFPSEDVFENESDAEREATRRNQRL